MIRRFGFILFAGAMLLVGGCVTRNEGTAELRVVDFKTRRPLEDAFVLAIEQSSVQKEGYFWVAREAPATSMVIRSARAIHATGSGRKIHQPGHVIATMGPYTRGTMHTWEYWIFRKGYMPERFRDAALIYAYEDQRPLVVGLEREQPGDPYSDEHVLDGTRRLQDAMDFLPAGDPNAGAALHLAVAQVGRVRRQTTSKRFRSEAGEILDDLKPKLAQYPPAEALAASSEPAPLPAPTTAPSTQPDPAPVPSNQSAEPAGQPLPELHRNDDSPVTQAAPKTEPTPTTQPAPAPRSQAGSQLSFRITARNPVTGVKDPLPDKTIERHLADLEKNGPQSGHRRGDEHLWFPCRFKDPRPDLVTAWHDGQRYLLLSNRPEDIMLPTREDTRLWGLQKLYLSRDAEGCPAVAIVFDKPGTKRFQAFTTTHLDRAVAILIDEGVQTAPVIKSVISHRAMIAGSFTPEQAEQIIDALRTGMPAQRAQGEAPAEK